jgi:lysozyme family protein
MKTETEVRASTYRRHYLASPRVKHLPTCVSRVVLDVCNCGAARTQPVLVVVPCKEVRP